MEEDGFTAIYERYVGERLEPTRAAARRVFRTWTEPNHWEHYSMRVGAVPSPVHRVSSRVKRIESVIDKIHRQPDGFPGGLVQGSLLSMRDTLGFRVVVFHLSNLALVHRELTESGDFEISTDMPPRALLDPIVKRRIGLDVPGEPRETGYASVHYVVRPRTLVDGTPAEWFEVQVRTLAEDAWGEIHHLLGYKPDKRTSLAVRRQFELIGRQLALIDEQFDFIAEELVRFQQIADELDSQTPLNAENLPTVLDEFGLRCAQREVDGLLKLLNSRGMGTVGAFRAGCTDRRIETIRSTLAREGQSAVGTFDVVSHLANIRAAEIGGMKVGSEDAQRSLILMQLAQSRATERLREQR